MITIHMWSGWPDPSKSASNCPDPIPMIPRILVVFRKEVPSCEQWVFVGMKTTLHLNRQLRLMSLLQKGSLHLQTIVYSFVQGLNINLVILRYKSVVRQALFVRLVGICCFYHSTHRRPGMKARTYFNEVQYLTGYHVQHHYFPALFIHMAPL